MSTFSPKTYLDALKRVDVQSIKQIETALQADLNMQQFQELCRYLQCNCMEVIERVAQEIGYVRPKKKKAAG